MAIVGTSLDDTALYEKLILFIIDNRAEYLSMILHTCKAPPHAKCALITIAIVLRVRKFALVAVQTQLVLPSLVNIGTLTNFTLQGALPLQYVLY